MKLKFLIPITLITASALAQTMRKIELANSTHQLPIVNSRGVIVKNEALKTDLPKSDLPDIKGTKRDGTNHDVPKKDVPQITWREHWWEHDLLVTRVFYDKNVAFYYDINMDTSVTWPFRAMSDTWAYVKKTYGGFGPDPRLYVVFHKVVNNKLGGGHPSGYFDASHDFHNTLDCGLGHWNSPHGEQIGMPIHEIGHIVTFASHGTKGSPSDTIWGDSKFMEIFIYDVLLHIGMEAEAGKVFQQMQTQQDDFPVAGAQWFKNWFYPIYKDHGKAAVLNNYFAVLAANFPKDADHRFKRDLNWGEFVHFWSGAAGVNLKMQATLAFGWPDEWETQFRKAQKEFPKVKYVY